MIEAIKEASFEAAFKSPGSVAVAGTHSHSNPVAITATAAMIAGIDPRRLALAIFYASCSAVEIPD
jgi:flavin reductase (DIM6/NTAB) family NADH-FMN oxidoreductase RutF